VSWVSKEEIRRGGDDGEERAKTPPPIVPPVPMPGPTVPPIVPPPVTPSEPEKE
jgi:hypothetical protein